MSEGFQSGIFWEAYHDLEKQLIQFLDYLPYESGNESAHSYRLLNILSSVGGYIDSSFKEIRRYEKYSERFDVKEAEIKAKNEELLKEGKYPILFGFGCYLEVINDIYKIIDKKVIFKRLPGRETIEPFRNREWWEIYNSTKHDLGKNINLANLMNTVTAMGAAFLINAVHEPSILRLYDYDILNSCISRMRIHQSLSESIPRNLLLEMLKRGQEIPAFLETDLFIYFYENE